MSQIGLKLRYKSKRFCVYCNIWALNRLKPETQPTKSQSRKAVCEREMSPEGNYLEPSEIKHFETIQQNREKIGVGTIFSSKKENARLRKENVRRNDWSPK